jgi:hypothetical protein
MLKVFAVMLVLAWLPKPAMATDLYVAMTDPSHFAMATFAWAVTADQQEALDGCNAMDVKMQIQGYGGPTPIFGSERCKVVGVIHDGQCFDLADDRDNSDKATGVGWSIANDYQTAVKEALAMCRKNAMEGRKILCSLSSTLPQDALHWCPPHS